MPICDPAWVDTDPRWLTLEWIRHGTVRGCAIGGLYPAVVLVVVGLATLPSWVTDLEAIPALLTGSLMGAMLLGLIGVVAGAAIGLATGAAIALVDLVSLRRLEPSLLAGSLVATALGVIALRTLKAEPAWFPRVTLVLLYGGPFMIAELTLWMSPIRRLRASAARSAGRGHR